MCASEAHIVLVSSVTIERKAQRLVARVSRTHKKLFEQAAAIEGRSVATFVVAHAVKAAEELLREQKVIQLNAEQSRRFVRALLAAPRPPTRRLKEAFALYRKTVTER